MSNGMPKPMVDVGGRPFLEFVLDSLVRAGVPEIILAVSYKYQLLQQHFGSCWQGVPVHYSIEATPCGTGGALLQCFEECALQRALVLNGDTLYQVDFLALLEQHVARQAMLTVALRQVEDVARYGAVRLDERDRITGFVEKGHQGPGVINAGVYIIERQIFQGLPCVAPFSFEQEILARRVEQIQPLGVVGDGYFIDIGIPEDLMRARVELPARGMHGG
jgi:D-glycero-alpha-D-manno-heptose 1-phosphate guanylyltransferase